MKPVLRICTATALAAWASLLLPLGPAAAAAQTTATPTATLTLSSGGTAVGWQRLQAVAEEAFRRIGHQVRVVQQPSERALLAADAGQVDGNGARVAGLAAQHPNLVQVPEPVFEGRFVAFARDRSVTLTGGWDALQPHRVAFLNGWKVFETHAGHARVVHRVDRPEQLFRMLDAGRVDLALYTLADGLVLARSLGLKQVVPLQPVLADVPLYLYLHRRHAALAPRLAQALRQMRADGTHARLLAATAPS